jgi:hypothetical protein
MATGKERKMSNLGHKVALEEKPEQHHEIYTQVSLLGRAQDALKTGKLRTKNWNKNEDGHIVLLRRVI